eukprot:244808-Prymnesium_polylepis.1
MGRSGQVFPGFSEPSRAVGSTRERAIPSHRDAHRDEGGVPRGVPVSRARGGQSSSGSRTRYAPAAARRR